MARIDKRLIFRHSRAFDDEQLPIPSTRRKGGKVRNRKPPIKRGNRRGLKTPGFPLGIINLMLFGLVFVMVLIGGYMVMDEPAQAGPASAAEEELAVDLSSSEPVNCQDYEAVKRSVLHKAEQCQREIDGSLISPIYLPRLDRFLEQCQDADESVRPDPIQHYEFIQMARMWMTRCDHTDEGYASAIGMAREIRNDEDAEHYERVLVREFYLGYLRGHNELAEGSTFEQDYPLEEYLDRGEVITELTRGHTEPLSDQVIEYLQISEDERYEILAERFKGIELGWMDNLASKHVEAGYDPTRVYTLYFDELLRVHQLDKAREIANKYLDGKGLEQIEDARIQKLLESGNYAVVERPDGTRVRVFPMNDDINVTIP